MAWDTKANVRGPAGYNATGAAEDDAAVAAFIKSAVGSTATSKAMDEKSAALAVDPATKLGGVLFTKIDSEVAPIMATNKPIGKTAVALGDSITGFNGSMIQQNPGWLHRLATESLGKIRLAGVGAYGTGGFTLEQMEATHLPQILALDPLPGACIVFGGTNNTGANTGQSFDFAASKATHQRILSKLEAVGIKPILVLIPPRDFNQLLRDNVALWNNTYIKPLARTGGYPLLDAHTPLATTQPMIDAALAAGDTTYTGKVPGMYKPGYSPDGDTGVHPNERGYDAISKYAIATGFLDNFTDYRRQPTYYKELVSNPRFTDTDANGLADNWNANPSNDVTKLKPSIIVPDGGDLIKGRWQQIELASGNPGHIQIQLGAINTDWAAGDTIEATFRIQTEGLLPSGSSMIAGVLHAGAESSPRGLYQWKRDIEDGIFRLVSTIPANTTALYLRVGTSGTSAGAVKLRVAEASVRNLNRTVI